MKFIDLFNTYLLSVSGVVDKFGNNIRYNAVPANISADNWWMIWRTIRRTANYEYGGIRKPSSYSIELEIDILYKYSKDIEDYAEDLIDNLFDTESNNFRVMQVEAQIPSFYEERGINVITIPLTIKYSKK